MCALRSARGGRRPAAQPFALDWHDTACTGVRMIMVKQRTLLVLEDGAICAPWAGTQQKRTEPDRQNCPGKSRSL